MPHWRVLPCGCSVSPLSRSEIVLTFCRRSNDREQALSRVFAAIEGMIQYNQPLRAECEVQSKVIYCANGTEIKALSSEYSTARAQTMA